MIKRLFAKLLPTLRAETGCSLSIGAVFLFFAYGAHRKLPESLGGMWRAGNFGEWAFAVTLLAVGGVAVSLPFISFAFGSSLQRRFAGLSLAFSAFVLVCAMGWSAGDALVGVHEGPRPFGVPVNGLLGGVALLELAILIYGGLQVLDDKVLLTALVGPRDLDRTLLGVNVAVTVAILVLLRPYDGASAPEAVVLALHVVFAITWARTRRVSRAGSR